MGSTVSVRCSKCHYHEQRLSGLGGGYGMSGDVVLTVICSARRALVDVAMPLNVARGDSVPPPHGEWPRSEPCEQCGATDHGPWDTKTAVCPSCGQAGCEILPVALWD